MFSEILVATDGSEAATAAVERAAALGARYDATVTALFAVESSPFDALRGGDGADDADEAAESVLADARERIADRGVAVESVTREGPAHEAVAEFVAERGVDLVVVGSSGRGGIGRRLLGSTTERVVRTAGVPTLVVHADDDPAAPVRLLYPTDGSEESDAALPYAVDLAEEFGASLRILSVVDDRAFGVGNALSGVLPEMREHHQDAVDRAAEYADDHGVLPEPAVIQGVPYEEIVSDAGVSSVDLIVMGSHGVTGVEHALIGSVAEKVLRRASMPVLVVPSDGGGS